MEACWIGHRTFPALIFGRLPSVFINSKHIHHQLFRNATSANRSQIKFQPSFPSKVCYLSSILQLLTFLILGSKISTCKLRVFNISKEELVLWGQFDFIVLIGIGFSCSNKDFKDVLIKQRGVAAEKGGYNIGVDHCSIDIEIFGVVAELDDSRRTGLGSVLSIDEVVDRGHRFRVSSRLTRSFDRVEMS